MRVRAGRPSDLEDLRTIRSAALDEPWEGLLKAALGEGPIVRVAVTDRPVGYAVALVAADHAYLPELAVSPEFQGQGYGSRLLEAVCSALEAEGVARVRLTARAGDGAARQFYEERDFVAVDRVADHFECDDGMIYERRLADRR